MGGDCTCYLTVAESQLVPSGHKTPIKPFVISIIRLFTPSHRAPQPDVQSLPTQEMQQRPLP
jgi:hypothetical protein